MPLNNADNILVGASGASRVYLGSDLIWEAVAALFYDADTFNRPNSSNLGETEILGIAWGRVGNTNIDNNQLTMFSSTSSSRYATLALPNVVKNFEVNIRNTQKTSSGGGGRVIFLYLGDDPGLQGNLQLQIYPNSSSLRKHDGNSWTTLATWDAGSNGSVYRMRVEDGRVRVWRGNPHPLVLMADITDAGVAAMRFDVNWVWVGSGSSSTGQWDDYEIQELP